jgi:hypothetical protein
MQMPLNSITHEMIQRAETIWAIDPNQYEYAQQVYGQERLARLVMPGCPAHQVQVLEVEIDSENPENLQVLLRQVQQVKGRLPQVVQPLLLA